MRRAATLALWLVLLGVPAFGQGCAMCWTTANSAGHKAEVALDRAIGVLMATTLGMIGGLAVIVYKSRNSGQDPANDEATDSGSPAQ